MINNQKNIRTAKNFQFLGDTFFGERYEKMKKLVKFYFFPQILNGEGGDFYKYTTPGDILIFCIIL